jgi:hypothetical protein
MAREAQSRSSYEAQQQRSCRMNAQAGMLGPNCRTALTMSERQGSRSIIARNAGASGSTAANWTRLSSAAIRWLPSPHHRLSSLSRNMRRSPPMRRSPITERATIRATRSGANLSSRNCSTDWGQSQRHPAARRARQPPVRSLMISRAALCPGAPVTPPPGCAPAPHR